MVFATKHYKPLQGTPMMPQKEKPDLYPVKQPRKKVLFVLPRLYPGGAERVLITLMNNLDRKRYDIEFVCLSGEGTIRHWIDNDIPICSLHKKRVSSSIVALYHHIKKVKPDSVISTMVHCNAALLLLKPFFKNTRFVVRESSLPKALIEEYGWKGKLCSYVYKYLYPMADLVVSPAQMITDEFKNDLRIKTHNHYTLPNPVNVARLQGTIKNIDSEYSRAQTQQFVCVGRLGYEKGYDRLIEALADYTPLEGMDWHLKIIGKGAETKSLGDLIRNLKLHKHIKLAGYQNIPWPFIAAADCLLLPSRWEGMPNVALEALACGTPVIAHQQAGGISEIAQASKEGDVQVFDTMKDFTVAMRLVKPSIRKSAIQSKLPEDFELQNVMQKFQSIL